jgi:signal transduction histidine kinase
MPDDDLNLPDTHRLALYRAAQEGLTNVQRHAAATQAWLRLGCLPNSVQLEVEDNGRGLPKSFALNGSFLPASGSYGLRGMQERLAQLGGRMELAPRPEGGTLLRVSLPFAAESKNG